jgi:hypothetical protein
MSEIYKDSKASHTSNYPDFDGFAYKNFNPNGIEHTDTFLIPDAPHIQRLEYGGLIDAVDLKIEIESTPVTVILPWGTDPSSVGEVSIDLVKGLIKFHADNFGDTCVIEYKGKGSAILSQDLNQITVEIEAHQDILVNATASIATLEDYISTGVWYAANGTQALPSITFTSDTNTGIYRPTSDTLAITTGGTASATFGSSITLRAKDGANNGSAIYIYGGAGDSGSGGNIHITTGYGGTQDGSIYITANHTLNEAGNVYVSAGVLSADCQIQASGGNISPAFAFFSDSDTGLYSDNSDTCGIACGGAPITTWTTTQVTNLAKTKIKSSAASALLVLDQDNTSAQFFDFLGTSSADTTNNISTLYINATGSDCVGPDVASWQHIGMIKITVNGVVGWIPYYGAL